jgi:hypothetical protein
MKYTILAAVAALAVGTWGTAHAQNAQSVASAGAASAPAAYQPSAGAASAPAAYRPSAGAASAPAAYQQGSAASLDALLSDWDRAGFNTPSKPSQYRVYGRNGYSISGPEYNTMVSLIRSAVRDAQQGRDQDAAIDIAKARGLLASVAPSAVTHANG